MVRIKKENLEFAEKDISEPMTLNIKNVNGDCKIVHTRLGMKSRGETFEDAMDKFCGYFDFMCKQFYEEDDENLGSSGLNKKRRLENMIDGG